MTKHGCLIFFCGKMGAGKTTQAKRLTLEQDSILLSEDEWLESLYPNTIDSLETYITCSNRLKPQIKKLVQSLLKTGLNVVMDFPANTRKQRDWLKSIYTEIEASHQLIYIDLPDNVCLARIRKRVKEQPERVRTDTAEMFNQVTKHFIPPEKDEEFNITLITTN